MFAASTYFYLPVDENEDNDIEAYERKYLTWVAEPSGLDPSCSSSSSASARCLVEEKSETLNAVLSTDDLYEILGVKKSSSLEKNTLRRAYLARSKACHPEYVPSLQHVFGAGRSAALQ